MSDGLKNRLIDFVLPPVLLLDRRGRRQAAWLGAILVVALAVTGSLINSAFLVISALLAYLAWTTIGRSILTPIEAKKILDRIKEDAEFDLVDIATQPDFKKREKFLGHYTSEGFSAGDVDLNRPFRGFVSCLNKYSLRRRFRVSLIELDGKKFVRKCYTPCDHKFYLGLRNNFIVRRLAISPPIRYVSIPDRTLWTEFVDGPSLTAVSDTTRFSDLELQRLIDKINGFHQSFHQLGLCDLDLHRGNIIMRQSDGEPVFIDLDQQRLFRRTSPLFNLRSRIDRIKLDEEVDLMRKRNQQNQLKNDQDYATSHET